MISLSEILEDPEKRNEKVVRLRLKVLGRSKCTGKNYGYMVTRSDVTLAEGDLCVFGDPIPYGYRGKTIDGSRKVSVKGGLIHLSLIKTYSSNG